MKPSMLIFLAMSTLACAKLEMLMYQIGGAYLNLGGTSTSGSNGMLYRKDGGAWKEVSSADNSSPCSKNCNDNTHDTYDIPGVRLVINACQRDVKNGACVPGGSFKCQFTHGQRRTTFNSKTSSKFWGLGDVVGTYCGGEVAPHAG